MNGIARSLYFWVFLFLSSFYAYLLLCLLILPLSRVVLFAWLLGFNHRAFIFITFAFCMRLYLSLLHSYQYARLDPVRLLSV